MSQTFTPEFDRLNFVDIHLSGGGSGSVTDGDFTVRVLRNGSVIRESEHLLIPAGDPTSSYRRFSFPQEANFSRNTEYEIELVNHSGTTYFSWCKSQNDSYPGGAPTSDPPYGDPDADFLFRTGMQSTFSSLAAPPTAGDYVYFESAPDDAIASSNSTSVSSGFFSGMNFEVDRPTRISQIGGRFSSGSQTVFGALFRATGFIDPPDSTDLTSSDVLATTLIDIPSRPFGGPPVDAFGEVDLVLEPGYYGVVFGSGLFGATGSTGLASVDSEYGSQFTYSFRTSDGSRFTQSSNVRVVVEGESLAGTHQVRPVYDVETQQYGGTWITLDGDSEVLPNLFPFYGADRRGMMEFSLEGVPEGAVITGAEIVMSVSQRSSGPAGLPSWSLHGFEGDGVLDNTSSDTPANEIGHSGPIGSFDPVDMDLDTAYLQSLVDNGVSHLGLSVRGSENGHSAGFNTWEWGQPQEAPLLTITYELPGDYDGDGMVGPSDYLVWQDSYGQSGAELAADGNGDGVVNAADYTVWRDHVVAASTTEAAPEPTSIFAAVFAVLSAIAWRRP
ncbi:hypothetical protein [Botrimarina colliarenosi]|nr:hypothetical protein [Botrimarina colliarenosi]